MTHEQIEQKWKAFEDFVTPQLIDRSMLLDYQGCPRKSWYSRFIYGTGITRRAASIPLATGGAVHVGLADLLRSAPVDNAIMLAHQAYHKEVSQGVQHESTEEESYIIAEQYALIEAFVRGYAAVRLPQILEQFEVIHVEKELDPYPLGPGILLAARPDAILRERDSGDYYLQSFKTTSRWDSRRAAEAEHDDQGISELVVAERALGVEVEGIRMEYLVKGDRKEYPEGSGRYVQWSPLIRGYRKLGMTSAETEYTARYQWKDENGFTRRLGKGWERFDVWGELGIRWWIDWLLKNDRDLLESQFVSPVPIFRRADDIESWTQQADHQFAKAIRDADYCERARQDLINGETYSEALDLCFVQHRRSCEWPSPCPYREICWGPVDAQDPLSSSDYVTRVPHHLVQVGSQASTGGVQKPLDTNVADAPDLVQRGLDKALDLLREPRE